MSHIFNKTIHTSTSIIHFHFIIEQFDESKVSHMLDLCWNHTSYKHHSIIRISLIGVIGNELCNYIQLVFSLRMMNELSQPRIIMDWLMLHDEWTAHWVIWWSMRQTKKDWVCDDVEYHINECVVFEWRKDERADEEIYQLN